MDPLFGQVAVVTGASSGMGEAIARALVIIGVHVIGVARNEKKLNEIGNSLKSFNGTFHPVRCDLRKEEDILNVFRYADSKLGGVNILVNGAGVLYFDPITEGKTANFREILEINTVAPAIAIREAVKSIRKHGKAGHIVNINSIFGTKISPFEVSLYEASKYALHAVTESIRQELLLRFDKIKVTGIYPGITNTGLASKAVGPFWGPLTKLGALFSPLLTVEHVADAVLFALRAPGLMQVDQIHVNPLYNPVH